MLSAGCHGIPKTMISVNPQSGAFTINSPKEIDAEDLSISLPSGATFTAKKLQSHNSPDVIASQAVANALQMEKANKMIENATKLVETLGLKAVTQGLAP